MAHLQFLSGSRDQELVELHDTASLLLGRGSEVHIPLEDDGIAPRHCLLYPAQGSIWLQDLGEGTTIYGLQRLKGDTVRLRDREVFILGEVYVKFWASRPEGCATCAAA